MEIISKIVMVSINETLFVELISFLIFLFLINRIMFRPLRAVMQERDQHITDLSQEINNARDTIRELHQQLDAQEKEAVEKATNERIGMENEGAKQAQTLLEESKQQISEIQAENERFVASQIAEARESLQKEAERLAREMMEKILDRRLARE